MQASGGGIAMQKHQHDNQTNPLLATPRLKLLEMVLLLPFIIDNNTTEFLFILKQLIVQEILDKVQSSLNY